MIARVIAALLVMASVALDQTPTGTVTFNSPNLTVTAGTETCTIARVAGPTVQIGQVCVHGVMRDARPIRPLLEGLYEYIGYINQNGDSIMIILLLDSSGTLNWKACATPAGIIPGHPGSANGAGTF